MWHGVRIVVFATGLGAFVPRFYHWGGVFIDKSPLTDPIEACSACTGQRPTRPFGSPKVLNKSQIPGAVRNSMFRHALADMPGTTTVRYEMHIYIYMNKCQCAYTFIYVCNVLNACMYGCMYVRTYVCT